MQALLQAITNPRGLLTAISGGQTGFTLLPQATDLQPLDPPIGVIETGRLKPSTRLMSKKSWPRFAAIVNSTKVAGGVAPAPLQAIWPEPQSAVAQVNLPFAAEQRVRAQNRPDHGVDDASTVVVVVEPGSSLKPVVEIGLPAPVKAPGHIGILQLFLMMKLTE